MMSAPATSSMRPSGAQINTDESVCKSVVQSDRIEVVCSQDQRGHRAGHRVNITIWVVEGMVYVRTVLEEQASASVSPRSARRSKSCWAETSKVVDKPAILV